MLTLSPHRLLHSLAAARSSHRITLVLLVLVQCIVPFSAFSVGIVDNHVISVRNGRPEQATVNPISLTRQTPLIRSSDTIRTKYHRDSTPLPAKWKSYQRSKLFSKKTADSDDTPSATSIIANDDIFDGKTTLTLIGAQSLLIVASAIAAIVIGTPNYGLGPEFALTKNAIVSGSLYSLPLFALAYMLDFVEKDVPALQNVTRATQRSVLALLGSQRKPFTALLVAIGLGAAAGIGEEMLFRGVLQSTLIERLGGSYLVGVGLTSVLFGALHAVTPLYAFLAGLASLFFGWIYASVGNLAVVMVCHGLYDVGALMWAHWTVTGMTDEERMEVMED